MRKLNYKTLTSIQVMTVIKLKGVKSKKLISRMTGFPLSMIDEKIDSMMAKGELSKDFIVNETKFSELSLHFLGLYALVGCSESESNHDNYDMFHGYLHPSLSYEK